MKSFMKNWKDFLTEQNARGVIVAIFGASGCGKTRYKKMLVDMGWDEIKSTVTRDPRDAGDTEYNFVSDQEWQALDAESELVNVNFYQGHHYGTRLGDFRNAKKAVMLTDFSSVDTLKTMASREGKNLIIAYCTAPEPEEIVRRHKERGTPERIEVALAEIEEMDRKVSEQIPDVFWLDSDEDLLSLDEQYGNAE